MKKVGKILASVLCVATLVCGALGALTGCGNKKTDIAVSGSTSVEAIMTPLAAEYSKSHTDIRININPNSSGAGITDTIEGRNDIGMSSRLLTDEETAKGIEGRNLCIDGVVLVVSKNCGIDEVTNEEVFNLYVNGTAITKNNATISVAIGREDGSGTRDAFDEQIEDASGKAIKKNYQYKSANELGGTGLVINAITTDTNNRSMGYVSMGSYLKNKDQLKALKFKAVGESDYVEASEATISDGSYKLQRPFVILTKSEQKGMSGAVREFYEWLFGPEVETIIRDAGYVIKK